MGATMRTTISLPKILLLILTGLTPVGMSNALAQSDGGHGELLQLFEDWREFESPSLLDGAPDYTAEQFASRYEGFLALRNRLHRIDPGDWPIPEQVDWHLVRAEMNGYDFNHRVLQPWVRDPAYYDSIWTARSDVPAHEGPTHHAVVELWTYDFPLSDAEETRLIAELSVIPPLMAQAQKNLTVDNFEMNVQSLKIVMTNNQSNYQVYRGLQKPLVFSSFKGRYIYWGLGSILLALITAMLVSSLINILAGMASMTLILATGLGSTAYYQQRGTKRNFKGTSLLPNNPLLRRAGTNS